MVNALRFSRGTCPCAVTALLVLGLSGCVRQPPPSQPVFIFGQDHVRPPEPPIDTTHFRFTPSPVRFDDITTASGLNYRWTIPGKRPLNILQTIGNGCAFLDSNNDGNLDILLVSTDHLALYKGDGRGHFTDVSAATGLDQFKGHFLGCAVGDYDNDGYDDLYISGYHTGILLHNEHGCRFRNVTMAMDLTPQPWGTSCSFADLDGDGYLDLFVCNYLTFNAATPQLCKQSNIPTGCGPLYYHELKGVLSHNLAGRRFENVTQSWGVDTTGNDLGVAFADFDGSGRVGFAVANDELGGDLFQNHSADQTDPKPLSNINVRSGTASDPRGAPHGGMGVDWGDYDNDGKLDFFVTTYAKEVKCLYHNEGAGIFSNDSDRTQITPSALPYVSFGCKFLDADNDGWLDLLIANGHVQDNIAKIHSDLTYRQPLLFLYNEGGPPVVFEDATASAGSSLRRPIVGRGLSIGDFDNDGRMDALVVDSEGVPLLLHNTTKKTGHWIGFHLIGAGRSNRDAYGAAVTVVAGGRSLMRICHADGSYLSSSDKRVHFGLGAAAHIDQVTVRWPDGNETLWRHPSIDRYHTWVENQPPDKSQK